MNLNNYIKSVLSGVKTWALSTFANKRDFDELNSRMYNSEQVEKFFFKNQQISPMDSYGDYVNMSFLEKKYDEIRVGDTLNVVWDGTKYECKVFYYDESLVIGNKSIVGTIMGESFVDTGEPFVIAFQNGYEVGFYYTDMVSESHVVSISGMVEKVHQIDKKYLPLKEDDVVLDFLKDFENSNKKHRRDLFTIIWSAIEDGRNIFILHNNDVEIGQKQMYVVYNAVINDDYDPRIDLRWKTGFEEQHMLLYSSGYYELTVNRTLNAISKTSTMNRKVGVDELSGELYSEDIISDKEAKALSNCAVLQESILATDLTDKYYSIAYDDSFDKFIAVPYYHSKELMTSENGLAFDENGEFYIEGYDCQTACGNGIIVALGERNTFYSTDQGATWNKSNENLGSNNYLIYANGFFIAVPSQLSTATCHYSADGKNWTAILRSSSYRATDIAFSQEDNRAIVLTSHYTICLDLRDNSIEESSTTIMLPSPTGVTRPTWEKILVDNDATDPNKSIYYFDGTTGLCAYGNVSLVNAFDFESFVPDADGATTFNYYIRYAGIIDDTIFAISTPTSSKHGGDTESVVFTKKRNGDTWEKTVLFDNKYYIDQVVVGKDRAIALVVDRDDKTQAHTVVTFDGKTWINKIATGNFITPDNSAINFVINGDKGSHSGAKPNQYLVTDSEGNVKWEDKLCWSEEGKVVLCEGVVADWVTANNSDNVRYCFKPGEAPTVGEVYTVWMRTEHGDEGTYEFVCEPSNEFDFWLVLTNSLKLPSDNYYSYNVYYDTREDYRRWVVDIPNSGEARADFRVTGITKTIHPIDKKYLPDTVVDKDYVDDEVAALVNSAPETLDTLGELAEAFQENKEVVDVLNEAIATKYSSSNPPPYPVTSVQGKTGAVNFTTETWTFTLSNGSTVTKKVLLG